MIFIKDKIAVYYIDQFFNVCLDEEVFNLIDKVCFVDHSLTISQIDRILSSNMAVVCGFEYDILSLCYESINRFNIAFIDPKIIWTDRVNCIKLAVFQLDKLITILNSDCIDINELMLRINKNYTKKFLFFDSEIKINCLKSQNVIDYVKENIL
ncbi:hypothetical protein M3B46_10050 [Sphingobacterium daejeonense]|uniref:hypothetical protein n=1 Tax=Sphingobacterium daejeonense TaxID=371142 RepID=UPI0021A912ED|nr:hypothetical protein [Sphingobacterium daejeonense]MCT1531338.1 hypothetical protein [Sphingobacterium daejeonense]